MNLRTSLRSGVSRLALVKPGRIPAGLVALVVGALVGASVFLVLPERYATVSQVVPSDPPAEQISSARTSVQDAKFMFTLMSGALTDATGSITTVVAGTNQVFDAVDKAGDGAKQLSAAFDNAPNVSAAAGKVGPVTGSISQALEQVKGLSGSAKQLDDFVTPLINALQRNRIPGTGDALRRLQALQDSARSMAKQLGSLDSLQKSLSDINGSIGSSARGIDGGIASAKQSADQLVQGFSTLSNARAGVQSAGKQITDGVGQLNRVLKSIESNLDSASTDLTPQGEGVAPAFTTKGYPDNADRAAKSVAAGAVAALAILALAWVANRRKKRMMHNLVYGDEPPTEPTGRHRDLVESTR